MLGLILERRRECQKPRSSTEGGARPDSQAAVAANNWLDLRRERPESGRGPSTRPDRGAPAPDEPHVNTRWVYYRKDSAGGRCVP